MKTKVWGDADEPAKAAAAAAAERQTMLNIIQFYYDRNTRIIWTFAIKSTLIVWVRLSVARI